MWSEVDKVAYTKVSFPHFPNMQTGSYHHLHAFPDILTQFSSEY
jgi:hypothetical protein